jgi:hypothetical protein
MCINQVDLVVNHIMNPYVLLRVARLVIEQNEKCNKRVGVWFKNMKAFSILKNPQAP